MIQGAFKDMDSKYQLECRDVTNVKSLCKAIKGMGVELKGVNCVKVTELQLCKKVDKFFGGDGAWCSDYYE